MKFRFYCSAWSNITYKREEELELDITQEDWDAMSEGEQQSFLDDEGMEWLFNDIEFNVEPVDNPETDGTIEGEGRD